MLYQFLNAEATAVLQTETRRCIYLDQPETVHTEAYLQWVTDGGVTEAYIPPVVVPPTPEQIQASIVTATQARLDAFAQTRNYDNALSACTYATDSNPKFAAEGQTVVNLRSATWAALYAYMADVQAGTKPFPSGFADVEPLLPTLAWGN